MIAVLALDSGKSSLTLLRQNAPPGRAGMNGEESPPKP